MTDATGTPFGVETIELDLPLLTGAFCRRLRLPGLPITPARAADLARALTLTRPVSRRRLYWTARAVLVSDPTQVAAFDAIFREIFGGRGGRSPVDVDEVSTVPTELDHRPSSERSSRARTTDARRARRDRVVAVGRQGDDDDRGRDAAGDGERRRGARAEAVRRARAG